MFSNAAFEVNAHGNTDLDWTGTRHSFCLIVPSRYRPITFVRKDNHTLCWNSQSSEIIGEVLQFYLKSESASPLILLHLPPVDNWAFQVSWYPRNPELLATAYFDGIIGIYAPQSTNSSAESRAPVPTPKPDGSDVFGVPEFSRTMQPTTLSHK